MCLYWCNSKTNVFVSQHTCTGHSIHVYLQPLQCKSSNARPKDSSPLSYIWALSDILSTLSHYSSINTTSHLEYSDLWYMYILLQKPCLMNQLQNLQAYKAHPSSLPYQSHFPPDAPALVRIQQFYPPSYSGSTCSQVSGMQSPSRKVGKTAIS